MTKSAFDPRRIAALVAVLVAAVLWSSIPMRSAVFNPGTFTLDNGMQVVVVPNHRVPVVTHMVWYRVGAMDEDLGQSGIAHLLEHLMFKGTKTRESGEFSRLVARNGGRENAFTSSDYTGYFQTVAKDRLALVMELEADRMRNLVVNADQVEPERLVVLEERRQRVNNRPQSILAEHIDAALYLNHPYKRPIIGWEHEIRALTPDAIAAFYRRWYAPNNALLVVAGDVTAAEVRPLAEKFYGAIPAEALPPRIVATEPPQRAARRIALRDARVRQPSISRTYLAPSYNFGETEHAYALQVLAEALGGTATTRLYRQLVVEQGLAISAGAWYDAMTRGPSRFVVYASPRPGVSMAALETVIDTILDDIIEDGLTQDEVDRAAARMRASAVYARDSLRTGARVLGEALVVGQSVEDVESWPERISAVTIAGVAAAARHVFNLDRSVTAQLLAKPADEAEGTGRAPAQ